MSYGLKADLQAGFKCLRQINKHGGIMEQKQLKQFAFYDLYWDLIRQLDDSSAERIAQNICRYMFTDEQVSDLQDDNENFFWSNIF